MTQVRSGDGRLDTLQRSTFEYFWEQTDPATGLILDNTAPDERRASIAGVGMALSSYAVGVERGLVARAEAVERVLATLRFFRESPHGPEVDATGHKVGAELTVWNDAFSPSAAVLADGTLMVTWEKHVSSSDEDIAGRHPPSCQRPQPHEQALRQAARVEAQLHGRRDLVDVLPAGARGPHEGLADARLVDVKGGSDLHASPY